ncbi:NAD(P)H dehydrogenase (quinone) [Streptomyces sp. V3I8]|uniref:NAD(P)H-binding protein n=1 Tax=Streptomyces sp. V3I8 TaxID=3042279 RepID=UPI0027870801|nr:NAD(P)H-binding protein [Streptomyces sp. V3I8]MDQ1033848.1 NAD(P)H dehydrogenase (quinone) [Streptomyces sp. V3I8]
MIGITGASGPLGRATAELVLRTVDPRGVVLTTRTPEALADLADRGAQVRRADFDDPRTVAAALVGVERLLLVSTDAVGSRLDRQRAAIAAAAGAGVSHIAYTSVPEPVPANPAVVVADHAGTEQALRESGLRWTALRNNLYAHMQVSVVEQAAATGRLVTNSGAGAAAYVTREDCAAAAAAVLTQDGHENQVIDITGPEAVSVLDLVRLAREIGGREVEPVDVDDHAFATALEEAGLPQPLSELVTSFGASTRGGFLARVGSGVADLTGREPRSFADVVRAARKP